MSRRFVALAAVLAAFVVLFSAQRVFAAVSSRGVVSTLAITERHGIGGDTVLARVLGSAQTGSASIPVQLGSGGLNQTSFPDPATALAAVQAGMQLIVNNYASTLAAYIASLRYASASLNWTYAFTDQSAGVTRMIYTHIVVKPNGSFTDYGFEVVNGTPAIMYYRYISFSADSHLPPGWAYSDAGMLTTEVLDLNFDVLSTSTIQTNGVYDNPQPGVVAADPNAGLKLLVSNVVVPGIVNNGAVFAIVDYVRTVVPVYDCDSDGVCHPEMAIDFQRRNLIPNDICTGPSDPEGEAKYQNVGVYGYVLKYTTDRYYVDKQGNFMLTATGYSTFPAMGDAAHTLPFDQTVTVPTIDPASLLYTVIDPFGTGQTYDYQNDTVNGLPCPDYIDGGMTCNAAPVTVSPPHIDWSFTASTHQGLIQFFVTQKQSGYPGVMRWRIFPPGGGGRCVRFDEAGYAQAMGYAPDPNSISASFFIGAWCGTVTYGCACSDTGSSLSCACPVPDPASCSVNPDTGACSCSTADTPYSCPELPTSGGGCSPDPDSGALICDTGTLACSGISLGYSWGPGMTWAKQGVGVFYSYSNYGSSFNNPFTTFAFDGSSQSGSLGSWPDYVWYPGNPPDTCWTTADTVVAYPLVTPPSGMGLTGGGGFFWTTNWSLGGSFWNYFQN